MTARPCPHIFIHSELNQTSDRKTEQEAIMPHLPLTYTCGAAPCLTFGDRTLVAVGGAADGFGSGRDEAIFIPPSTDLKWL